MIEVDLLPAGKRRSSSRKRRAGWFFKRAVPTAWGRPAALIAAAWVMGLLVIGWLFLDTRARRAGLEIELERAAHDSARYALLVEASSLVQARQDTIAQKLQLIQELDAARYVWPHLLDELGRRLPDQVWLTAIGQTEGGPVPTFRLEGRAGSTFVLTRYMRALESSPFIRGVHMSSTERVREGEERVYRFILVASYERPPPGSVETRPFFGRPKGRDR